MTTVLFTLPISCQICLGKVKQPVICPNQHAFCAVCMDIWLQRNNKCPTCRIVISPDNPCKPVLGGLSRQESASRDESVSSCQLRRTRMDLIVNDYETEITRLKSDLECQRHENAQLLTANQCAIHRNSDIKLTNQNPPLTSNIDISLIHTLKDKLKDASVLYESLKADIDKEKRESAALREQNINLTRENERLRLDLANRSPRRYGRYTVVALESKLEACEKEIQQLHKALEKSDAYIEDLKSAPACTCNHTDQPTNADQSFNDSQLPSAISSVSSEGFPTINRPLQNHLDKLSSVFDEPSSATIETSLNAEHQAAIVKHSDIRATYQIKEAPLSSFTLELPSAVTESISSRHSDLVLYSSSDLIGCSRSGPIGCSSLSKKTSYEHTVDSCKKKLRFSLMPELLANRRRDMLESTSMSDRPVDRLNTSTTPEIEDCMRRMEEAEHKVRQRDVIPTTMTNYLP